MRVRLPDNPAMHICHVITRLIIGGAQENTLLTCEGLAQRGYQVTLISGPTEGPEGSLVPRARGGGFRFLELPELVRAVHPWKDLRARARLRALFQRLRPDVVHTHSSKAGILARLAAHAAGVPILVHTIHGMSFNRTQPWPVRRFYALLERRAAAHTHALVAVADAMVEQSLTARIAPPDRFVRIYSGMPLGPFEPGLYDRTAVRASWGVSPADDVVVVGTVARLFRRKGYEQLIPILAEAARRESRLRFVWIGDGAQRGLFERELERRGLRERTVLTGLVAPEEIPRLLAGFDILAHASQWEGLPRAVVQALLMQVPAVAFELDGTPEVVLDGRTGRLVPPGDLAAFATALVELARQPQERRRLGAAGRAHCLERFDARRMVEEIERLYLRLRGSPASV